ncbi:MAG: uL15m family ribosomal protein, partial [Bacteroidota bacterium]
FKNINRVEYKAINLKDLEYLANKLKTDKIDITLLHSNGMISKNDLVKILGNGELTLKLEVHAHAFSKKAVETINSLGGTVVTL